MEENLLRLRAAGYSLPRCLFQLFPEIWGNWVRHYRELAKMERIAMRRVQSNRLWYLYRITPQEQADIINHQDGKCPITKKTLVARRWGTDHDHKTGLIRGIIDWRVNRGLSFFDDDPALLRAAADYLENPPATLALGAPRYGLIGKAIRKKKPIYGPPA